MEGIIAHEENEIITCRFFALLDNMEKRNRNNLARDNVVLPSTGTVPDRQGAFGTLKIAAGARITGTRTDSHIQLGGKISAGNRTSRSCWRRTITLH